MALDESLERVLRAYDRERLHPAPTEVVAQNVGYKSANSGSALSALASLRYFGLLERPKEGFLAVTKDVESYKYAPDEEHRRALLLSFLKKPPLYADLLERYRAGLPSEANLRHELITQRGFSPQAAGVAQAAFRRSVEFVGYFDHDRSAETLVDESGSPDEAPAQVASTPPALREMTGPTVSTPADGTDDVEVDRIPVRLPGGRRAWLLIPTPFYSSDKTRLKAQIDLLLTEDEERDEL